MATTLAAYVYDATTGVAKRTVVSDDYADAQALKAMHCAPGEDALVVHYVGTFDENRIAMAIARLSDDEVQAAITAHCKIDPPPKQRYALTGPTGRVFEVIETRNPNDARLQRNAAFEQVAAVRQVAIDAALAVVAQFPDLDLILPALITRQMRDAHDLVARARAYGVIPDTDVRDSARLDTAIRDAERRVALSGFTALAVTDLDTGDLVQADGTVRKLIRESAPVEQPVVGNTRIVL